MALPAISARRAAAVSIWPRWRRSAWIRGSNGASEPRAASSDSAPVTRAERKRVSASKRPARAFAVENCVPLRSARPSFGREHDRLRGPLRQAPRPPAARGRRRALRRRRSSQPPCGRAAQGRPRRRPSPARERQASRRAANIASMRSSVSARTPEAPWARLRELQRHHQPRRGDRESARRRRPRATARCCAGASARSAAAIRTPASLPNPVLIP